ncbi:DUF5018 domain-containing protein [Pedobacter sp. ASV1-7]|uniref:DUF5018 domain-containing protein n=1 Tax=Pedobacter sp. ASV1-7 TaxID=3145237 RepID=UPI0032E906A6
MKKFIYISLLVLTTAIWGSCKKADPVIRNSTGDLTDIFANTEASGAKRMFEPRFSNDTIYFDIPYFYPVDTDYETDLRKIILRASLSADAVVSPQLGFPMDLTAPVKLTVTSGSGESKTYVVVAKRVGDVSISNVKMSYTDGDGALQELDAIAVDDELRFFILPGTDVSQSKINFSINQHSSASIANGAVVDLSNPFSLKVSAQGDVSKTYKLIAAEPTKLDYGFGIHRRLWTKLAADLGGFSAVNETCLAVSGDHLIITTLGTAGTSKYRVYNRFTGQFIQNMYMPFNAASGALSQTNQLVADDKGALLAINRAAYGTNFRIYKYKNAFDTNPELLVNFTNSNPALATLTTLDRGIGRRINVSGDLATDAVIFVPIGQTLAFYKWVVKNGTLQNAIPEIIFMTGLVGTHFGFVAEVQPLTADANTNYLMASQWDFAYLNGSTNANINSFSLANAASINFRNALSVAHFNNATYAALMKYMGSSNLNRAHLSLFDITNPARIPTPSTDPSYSLLNVYNSEAFIGTQTTGGAGDVAIGYSNNGDRMQIYMLLSGHGVLAHEFTVYSAE